MSRQQDSKTAKPQDDKFAGLRGLRNRPTAQGGEQKVEQPASKTAEQETVKATFYLLPHQPDDIDEWQLAIKRATGKRVEKSELVRFALQQLAKQFASKTAEEIYAEMQS
ncbi:MAG: hypothetical protein M3R24_03070 [Chloroflexota bacterium]|nr:hypothetical protein [Chloroflexota bacterium]